MRQKILQALKENALATVYTVVDVAVFLLILQAFDLRADKTDYVVFGFVMSKLNLTWIRRGK